MSVGLPSYCLGFHSHLTFFIKRLPFSFRHRMYRHRRQNGWHARTVSSYTVISPSTPFLVCVWPMFRNHSAAHSAVRHWAKQFDKHHQRLAIVQNRLDASSSMVIVNWTLCITFGILIFFGQWIWCQWIWIWFFGQWAVYFVTLVLFLCPYPLIGRQECPTLSHATHVLKIFVLKLCEGEEKNGSHHFLLYFFFCKPATVLILHLFSFAFDQCSITIRRHIRQFVIKQNNSINSIRDWQLCKTDWTPVR